MSQPTLKLGQCEWDKLIKEKRKNIYEAQFLNKLNDENKKIKL